MPAIITPERKQLLDSNINKVLQEPGWKYRSVSLCPSLERVTFETIQAALEHILEHVEDFDISIQKSSTLNAILEHICSPRAARLKKLRVRGSGYYEFQLDVVSFPGLYNLPCLEELELSDMLLSFQEGVEEFFATTTSLQKLVLACVNYAVGQEEVAHAIRRGLQRNLSLTSVKLEQLNYGIILRECIVGLTGHRYIQDLRICMQHNFLASFISDQTSNAIQAFLSNTSLRKVDFDFGDNSPFPRVFLGLSTNSSVVEVVLQGPRFFLGPPAVTDAPLANAIRACCANNNTLRTVNIVQGEFGPLSRQALTHGVSVMNSLKNLKIGGWVVNEDILLRVPRILRASMTELKSPDWSLLTRGMQNTNETILEVFDLSTIGLSTRDLKTILPNLSQISELVLKNCGITFESTPAICEYIQTSTVKRLNLSCNPLGVAGAARVFDAASGDPTIQHINMASIFEPEHDEQRDRVPVNLNGCHGSLRSLLVQGGLVSLDLENERQLEGDATRSLAAGLRESTTLKIIRLPSLDLAALDMFGQALVINRSLESIESGERRRVVELTPAEEESVVAFLAMMPRMKSLVHIKSLFDFNTSHRITKALISALKSNAMLKEITGRCLFVRSNDYICSNESVQFYLQMNRLGRQYYQAAPENKPVPVGVLPHLFARMSDPEYASHLYYFLRHTSPDLLGGGQLPDSSRKRKANP